MGERTSRFSWWWLAIGAGGVVLIVLIFALAKSYWGVKHHDGVYVRRADQVCRRDSDGKLNCQYLVFTDSGTFRVDESLVLGRLDATAVFGSIEEKHCYDIDTAGWNMPWSHTYENIKDIEEVPCAG